MPVYVVSVSTPGIALMDYVKNGSDQLDVKKGTSLRILKRYNHCELTFHGVPVLQSIDNLVLF